MYLEPEQVKNTDITDDFKKMGGSESSQSFYSTSRVLLAGPSSSSSELAVQIEKKILDSEILLTN